MSFIRIKTRKNARNEVDEYGYLVVNSWGKRKKMPKQKVAGYLGRIYRFENSSLDYVIGEGSFHTELRKLIENQLLALGFDKIDGKYLKDEIIVDLEGLKVLNKKNKDCLVMVNNGFICSWSLKKLFGIEHPKVEDASYIAKSLRGAGINIDGENFVRLLKV